MSIRVVTSDNKIVAYFFKLFVIFISDKTGDMCSNARKTPIPITITLTVSESNISKKARTAEKDAAMLVLEKVPPPIRVTETNEGRIRVSISEFDSNTAITFEVAIEKTVNNTPDKLKTFIQEIIFISL